jgi:hypothetical protein
MAEGKTYKEKGRQGARTLFRFPRVNGQFAQRSGAGEAPPPGKLRTRLSSPCPLLYPVQQERVRLVASLD